MIFLAFPLKKNGIAIRDILSWLDICLIKALRNPRPHQRYPKAGMGAWQTLLRMPIVESERLPKEAAGPGLASTLLPRNLEEDETQHEETTKIS